MNLYIMNYMIMVKKMKNSFKSYAYSGTVSFDIILKKLNEFDEVIVPVTLCQSVIDVIINNKLTPIFVDIDNNFLIDKKDIMKKISKKTKVIIFVEQYGNIIFDEEIYYNKKGEKIIKILDSCQNGIKKTNDTFDYVVYSFNKRKPIDLNKYSMVISKTKIFENIKMPFKCFMKLYIKRLLYKINYRRKKYIKKIISENIKIPGFLIDFPNYSYHRIIYVMDVSKKDFLKIEDKLYQYMEENNMDIVQTTIEETPYEKLRIKSKFKNFEALRYKTLYFRTDNKISNYYKIINYLNEILGDEYEKR